MADYSKRAAWAWCFYDWANSAFATVVTTFVFAPYFAGAVMGKQGQGDAAWAEMIAWAGVTIAILAPILGAIADKGGRLKPYLAVFTGLMVLVGFGLWWVTPDPSSAMLCLWLVGLGIVAFELGMVFYNAMLPRLAPPDKLGRLSGLGWGLGYVGGLTALVLALVVFIGLGDTLPALIPFSDTAKEAYMHVRITGPLVALWLVVFTAPLFLFVPGTKPTGIAVGKAISSGLSTLVHTIKSLPKHRRVAWFLIASMFYRDGLNTLFAMGGIFAGVAMGMDQSQILIFAIGLNVTAGAGAILFGLVDDRIGPDKTILIALVCLLGLSFGVLMAQSIPVFIGLSLLLGIFVGPAQAAGRSLMARLSPPEVTTEMFGLYAMTGKATSFIGPALYSILAAWGASSLDLAPADASRLGMSCVAALLLLGLVLMIPVMRGQRSKATPQDAD